MQKPHSNGMSLHALLTRDKFHSTRVFALRLVESILRLFSGRVYILYFSNKCLPITRNSNSNDLRRFLTERINNAKDSDSNERVLMDSALENKIFESLSTAT